MANIDFLGSFVKKELKIFYVLDTSKSMRGNKINMLNVAMRSTVSALKAKNGDQAEFKIGVLSFGTDVKWITRGVEELDDFIWDDITAEGKTSLGKALDELSYRLSRNDIMKSHTGNKCPIIIFMSDGNPTDEWQSALLRIADNKWYREAIKIAFAIGAEANRTVLSRVIGVTSSGKIIPAPQCVIEVNSLSRFEDMLQAVSVTSSLAASSSRVMDEAISPEEILRQAGLIPNEGKCRFSIF